MTSARKRQTNRTNARASTGPRTLNGKSRASQNARRHGLSTPLLADPVRAEEIERLARQIAGEDASPERLSQARLVAEAQTDLTRVRQIRQDFLKRSLDNPKYRSLRSFETMVVAIKATTKAVTKALKTRIVPPREATDIFAPIPNGPEKHAEILFDLADQLDGLDRYERRALSRRKFAIRAFDALTAETRRPRQDIKENRKRLNLNQRPF